MLDSPKISLFLKNHHCRLLLIGFVIFLGLTLYSAMHSHMLRDEILYLSAVENTSGYSHRAFSETHIPPLLPIFLRSTKACHISPVAAGRAAMIGCGFLFIAAVYLTVRFLFSDPAFALVSFYVSLFHYYVVFSSVHILRDGPYMTCFALTMACIAAGGSTKKLWEKGLVWLMGFLMAGMGMAFRREGLELPLILWLALLINIICDRNDKNSMFCDFLIGIIGTFILITMLRFLSCCFSVLGFDWDVIKACLHRLDYVHRVWKIF